MTSSCIHLLFAVEKALNAIIFLGSVHHSWIWSVMSALDYVERKFVALHLLMLTLSDRLIISFVGTDT